MVGYLTGEQPAPFCGFCAFWSLAEFVVSKSGLGQNLAVLAFGAVSQDTAAARGAFSRPRAPGRQGGSARCSETPHKPSVRQPAELRIGPLIAAARAGWGDGAAEGSSRFADPLGSSEALIEARAYTPPHDER